MRLHRLETVLAERNALQVRVNECDRLVADEKQRSLVRVRNASTRHSR